MSKIESSPQIVSELFSTEQAASYLGCSHDTIRRLAHLGELPVVQLFGARNWRFHRKDIDEYISRVKMTL